MRYVPKNIKQNNKFFVGNIKIVTSTLNYLKYNYHEKCNTQTKLTNKRILYIILIRRVHK